MRELGLLMKYIGLSISGVPHKRKSVKKINYAQRYLVSLLLGSLPIGVFIYISNYELYSKLYNQLKIFPQVQQVGTMMYLMSVTMFSLFYIVGFVGTGMYAFSKSEEMEFLLTLPINRRVLTIYNLIVSLSSQLVTVVFLLGATLGYMSGFKNYSVDFILRTILHFYFLTSMAALFSVLGGGVSSKSFVRKLNVIITLFLIFIYLGFMYLQDIDVEKLGKNANIARWLSFTASKWNVITWSYSENKILLSMSIVISLVSTLLFWFYSEKVVYESDRIKLKNNLKAKDYVKKGNYASRIGAILWKDLKLLLRNEQVIFLILYPLAFGIFMILISGYSISSTMPFIAIAVFYCAMESGLITMNEFKYKELLMTLPTKRRTIIMPKLIVPVLLNMLLFFLINVFALIFGRFNKTTLYFIPISTLLFALSALIGSYYSITKPGKAKNQPFSMSATFMIEGITIGLAFGMIYPTSILFSKNVVRGLRIYVSWIVFISSLLLSFVLLYVYYRKLRKILGSNEI